MGGIQGWKSQEAGKVWALMLDLLRQKQREGIMVSVDAHTCYNRMQHLVVLICCQRLGVPLMAVICMLSTLQNMQYYLHMGHRESSTYYGGPWLIPFQGGYQGNEAAPGFLITISIVLVRYLTGWGHAEAINLAISTSVITFSAILFMDNMDLPAISRQGEMSEVLLAQVQWKVSDWQRGLQVTGGDLKAAKCNWCWICFHWQKGQWKYTSVSQLPGTLLLMGLEGKWEPQQEEIPCLEPEQAIKALGFWVNARGDARKMVEELSCCA